LGESASVLDLFLKTDRMPVFFDCAVELNITAYVKVALFVPEKVKSDNCRFAHGELCQHAFFVAPGLSQARSL